MNIINDILESYEKMEKVSCIDEICVTDRMKSDYLISQKYLVLTYETYNYIEKNLEETFKKIKEIPLFFDDKKIEEYLKQTYADKYPFESVIQKPLKWED